MRTSMLAVLVAGLLVGMSACKKDSTNPAGSATTSITGTWAITSATVNGQPTDPSQIFNYTPGTASARFIFNVNGSFTYEERDAQGTVLHSETGTFSVSGQSVTVTITHSNGQPLQQPIVIAGTFVITGNQLTFTTQMQGSTVVLVFTRT